MNIDLDSQLEQHIKSTIEQDRGTANCSFEGENHFKFIKPKNFPNTDHNTSLMEESYFEQGERSIRSSDY